MRSLILTPLTRRDRVVEVVERKGLGHPDTICDALAENFSRNLSRAYLDRFGRVLHHNVDKALLCGGRSTPAFGGGSIDAPIEIYLAGRATTALAQEKIDVEEIAIEGSRAWLKANIRALNTKDVRIHCVVRPGSQELQGLLGRDANRPLANDTSFGVGYAPLSNLERLILEMECSLNGRDRTNDHPAWGEDIKIMGIRNGPFLGLTISCAMIGRYVSDLSEYITEKEALADRMRALAGKYGFGDCSIAVNAADNPRDGRIYLTVSGTSAEAGDDGQVGRGNRVNGLITPGRAMSLEAAAGKNPVSHVGKIYNVLAQQVAQAAAALPGLLAAECIMVSQIGAPIDAPALVEVKVAIDDARSLELFRAQLSGVVSDALARAPQLVDHMIAGEISFF